MTYFNRALAEEWTDGYGGVVYVDVFSRDVVGMGNYSTVDDGESIFYNIQSWYFSVPASLLSDVAVKLEDQREREWGQNFNSKPA